jgi:hypothetical protein
MEHTHVNYTHTHTQLYEKHSREEHGLTSNLNDAMQNKKCTLREVDRKARNIRRTHHPPYAILPLHSSLDILTSLEINWGHGAKYK